MSETSSPEPTSTFTSAAATATSTLLSATTTFGQPAPTDTPFPIPQYEPPSNPLPLLCDWTREASNCRDAEFIRWTLVASSALHFIALIFGFWLLAYRNRGLNSKIVTELYTKVGTGVRPKPMDCIVFWVCIACIAKIIANFPLIFDVLRDSWWLRIALEQLYWIFVAIAFSSYFVGLLYAMPVTTREGIFAVYQPEVAFGAKPLSPIHVLTPTTVQKNFMLIMGLVYPTIFGACMGIVSGILHDMGRARESRIFLLIQYSNWVLILWSMAALFFYYGLKYTFILRANIIIAEAALKAPRAAFGIGNLRSSSPARFLFIQLQIMGFGGCAVTLLAGTLCMIWVLFKDEILKMPVDHWPHAMAFFWTGAIAVAYMVIMALVSVQSVRNRRRGLHEPSSTSTQSYIPSGSGSHKGSKDSTFKVSGGPRIHSQLPTSSFDPEARLTEHSSVSTLHSRPSLEKAYGETTESVDDILTSPFLSSKGGDERPYLRDSVFGTRSPQTSSANNSHPRSSEEPVSVPLVHVRNSSSHAGGSRPSISSGHYPNSATSSRVSNVSSSTLLPNSPVASQTTPSSSHISAIHSIPEDTTDLVYQNSMARKQPQPQQYAAHPSPRSRTQQPPSYPQQPSPALQPLYRSPPQSPRHPSQPPQPQQQQSSPQQPYVHYPQYTSRADVTNSTSSNNNSNNNNVQTQQQHPLHQVAYRGLSPPPRAKRAAPTPPSAPSPALQGYAMPAPLYATATVPVHPSPPLQPVGYQQQQQQQHPLYDGYSEVPRISGSGIRRGSQQNETAMRVQHQVVRSDSDSEVSVEGLMPMPPTHR